MARSMPNSPALTARRALEGAFIHLSERIKSTVATRYTA